MKAPIFYLHKMEGDYMAEKYLNTRIQLKHDIEANWNKATGFIPKLAEVIIYDIDDNYGFPRMKVGDGKTVVTELPFVYDPVTKDDIDEICSITI